VSDKRLTDEELYDIESLADGVGFGQVRRLVAECREHRERERADSYIPSGDPEPTLAQVRLLAERHRDYWKDRDATALRAMTGFLSAIADRAWPCPDAAIQRSALLPVEVLADARHDRIHEDAGPSRPAVRRPAPPGPPPRASKPRRRKNGEWVWRGKVRAR
jgi:hypothetical protein